MPPDGSALHISNICLWRCGGGADGIRLSCGNKVLRRPAAITDLVTIPLYLFPVLIGEHLKSDLVEDIVFKDMAFQLRLINSPCSMTAF